MSEPVTIPRPTTTTTTTTSNAIRFNCDYVRTIPGILKISELILGATTIGCVGYAFGSPELFFLLMATTFMMCTFFLLLSSVVTWRNSKHVSETMFELIYHVGATFFMLCASITLATGGSPYYYDGANTAAYIIGIFNTLLYLLSAFFAYQGLKDVQPESGYYNSNSIRDFSTPVKTVSEDSTRYI